MLRRALNITKRNWIVYKQNLLSNIAPTFAEPLFFTFSIGLGVGFYIADVEGKAYVTYMAPGLAMASAMMTSFFETSYNFYIRYEYEKVYTALMTSPLSVMDIIVGEYIWLGIKGAFMSSGVCLTFLLLGYIEPSAGVFWIPLAGVGVSLTCGSLGFLSSTLVRDINQFQTVYTVLISPMFFFSGVFFPTDRLPPAIAWLTEISPLYHGVRIGQMALWREIFWPEFISRFLILVILFPVLFAVASRRVARMLYH